MEKDPSNNPEIINQQPAADENAERQPLPYEEEMDKRQHYEHLFNEMKQKGTLPESVTDPYELREYTEETEAHTTETLDHEKKLFESIKSIDDPRAKDYLTASLGFISDLGLKLKLENKDIVEFMDLMMDYVSKEKDQQNTNDDKKSIYDYMYEANFEKRDNEGKGLNKLIEYCWRIEQFSEANSIDHDNPENDEKIINNNGDPVLVLDGEDVRNASGGYEYVFRFNPAKQDPDSLVVRHNAKKIINNPEMDPITKKGLLHTLSEWHEKSKDAINKEIHGTIDVLKGICETAPDDRISTKNKELKWLFALDDVEDKIEHDKEVYQIYKDNLKKGQQILDSLESNSGA